MITFSTEGQWLAASGIFESDTLLWNLDYASAPPIILETQSITAFAFSPTEPRLATANFDHTIRLWNLDINQLMIKACEVLGRNFTRAEWEQYFPNEEYRKTCDPWPLETEVTATPLP